MTTARLGTTYRLASLRLSQAAALPTDGSRRADVEKLVANTEVSTPSALHLVFAGVLRCRHNLPARPEIGQLLDACRQHQFGYGEAVIVDEFGLGTSELTLTGAIEYSDMRTEAGAWVIP